ncbi:histidine kinase [Actinophytocola sp. KF-1]
MPDRERPAHPRRIDGTQNRLIAVNVLLGGARRALTRDPGAADAMLGRAQDEVEAALAELRGFLPPG